MNERSRKLFIRKGGENKDLLALEVGAVSKFIITF